MGEEEEKGEERGERGREEGREERGGGGRWKEEREEVGRGKGKETEEEGERRREKKEEEGSPAPLRPHFFKEPRRTLLCRVAGHKGPQHGLGVSKCSWNQCFSSLSLSPASSAACPMALRPGLALWPCGGTELPASLCPLPWGAGSPGAVMGQLHTYRVHFPGPEG